MNRYGRPTAFAALALALVVALLAGVAGVARLSNPPDAGAVSLSTGPISAYCSAGTCADDDPAAPDQIANPAGFAAAKAATATKAPATATKTPLPPTATKTTVPPTATKTLVPPTATKTTVPATATKTTVPATATKTTVPATATKTPLPPTATATTPPPTATATTPPPTATATTPPPTATATLVPPTATKTPLPPTATATATTPPPTATPLASPSPSPSAGAIPTDASTITYGNQVLALLNTQRQNNGCAVPLTYNQQLWNAAQRFAVDMATNGYFPTNHIGRDGSYPEDRISAEGYNWSMIAENLAAGYGTPSALVTAWMNSAGHRANILNCSLKEVGIGYYYVYPDPNPVTNYKNYWVADFGTQVGAATFDQQALQGSPLVGAGYVAAVDRRTGLVG